MLHEFEDTSISYHNDGFWHNISLFKKTSAEDSYFSPALGLCKRVTDMPKSVKCKCCYCKGTFNIFTYLLQTSDVKDVCLF